MIRTINQKTFLYLCQSSDWQCVVCAEDEEAAATLAVEYVMESKDSDTMNMGVAIVIKKLENNLFEQIKENEPKVFYAPIILANAGYYNEAQVLDNFFSEQNPENEERK